MKQYNLGRFNMALKAFEEGYLAKPDPAFLFNIGQCHRQTGNPEKALYAYRRYLGAQPDTPNRVEVESFIAQAEAEIKRRHATAPPMGTIPPGDNAPATASAPSRMAPIAPTPPSPGETKPRTPPVPVAPPASSTASGTGATRTTAGGTEQKSDLGATSPAGAPSGKLAEPNQTQSVTPNSSGLRRYLAPVLVGVVALAAAGTSLGLYLSVDNDFGSLTRDCAPTCSTGKVDDLRTRASVLYVLSSIAGIAAVADVLLWVSAARQRAPERRVQVLPAIGGLVIRGSF